MTAEYAPGNESDKILISIETNERAKKLDQLLREALPRLYTARRNAITEQERKQIDELIQRVEGEV